MAGDASASLEQPHGTNDNDADPGAERDHDRARPDARASDLMGIVHCFAYQDQVPISNNSIAAANMKPPIEKMTRPTIMILAAPS